MTQCCFYICQMTFIVSSCIVMLYFDLGVPQLLNVDTQLKTCTSVGITWEQQPGASTTFVTVTYCPTSSPKCGTSTTCTINPCTIYGLAPNTSYDIIVIPNNTCGMGSAIAAIVTTPPGKVTFVYYFLYISNIRAVSWCFIINFS